MVQLGKLDNDFCVDCGRCHRHQVTDHPVNSHAILQGFGLARVTDHCADGRATFRLLDGANAGEVHTFHDSDGWLKHTILINSIDLEYTISMGVAALRSPDVPKVERIDRYYWLHVACIIDKESYAQRIAITEREKDDHLLPLLPSLPLKIMDFAARKVKILIETMKI